MAKKNLKDQIINPSQFLIGVKDIRDGYLIVNGGLRGIVGVSGIDLDLLEDEIKDQILNGYMGFIAKLSTPIQEYIVSKTLDTSKYMENYVQKALNNPRLTEQQRMKLITGTKHLLRSSIERWAVTEKRFYVVVCMDFKDIPTSSILDDLETDFVSYGNFTDSQWAVIKEKADNKINEIYGMLSGLSLDPYLPSEMEIISLFKNEFRKDSNVVLKDTNEIVVGLGLNDSFS